jgi:hypothetical protein
MVVLDLSSCDGSSVLFFSFSPSARSNPHAMAAAFFGTRCKSKMQEREAKRATRLLQVQCHPK